MHEVDDNTPPDVSLGHETRDISTRVVVIFAASLVIGAVIIHIAVWLVYLYFGGQADKVYASREYPLAAVGAPRQPPAPRLQTQPREELKQMRNAENKRLEGYSWVSPSGGIVSIPIEQAMKLTLEQGLPARAAGGVVQSETRPERSSSGRTAVGFQR